MNANLNKPFNSSCWLSLLMLVSLGLFSNEVASAPKPLSISKAQYNQKQARLQVITNVKNLSGKLSLLHGNGGLLDEQTISGKKQTFLIPLARLGQVPCSIEVLSGEQRVSKAVTGAPADCKKIPVCQIIAPANWTHLDVNQPFDFKANVRIKDPKAKTLSYEWDFGGGVMGVDGSEQVPNTNKPAKGLSGTTQFVRDNSKYRIRFSATDQNKRRCEAFVDVKVGTPATDDPNFPSKVAEVAVAEKSMPLRGSENNGESNDLVVLPFEDWTMQNQTDARMKTAAWGEGFYSTMSFGAKHSNLRAHVIKKGSVGSDKPVYLDDAEVKLQYAAASNPLDPVGPDSINSTSQNWPLDSDITEASPLMAAKLQKTDWWETYQNRPDSEKSDPATYTAVSLFGYMDLLFNGQNALPTDAPNPAPDQGVGYKLASNVKSSRMPGKNQPYAVNNPQDFGGFEASNQWFEANEIPITDIDDQGRVNPYPLLRVQVLDKTTGQVRAATDAVLSNSKDFQCRECHSKGQIGGKSSGHSANACQYSPWHWDMHEGMGPRPTTYCQTDPKTGQPRNEPDMFAANDDWCPSPTDCQKGDVLSLFDQEFAAARNYMSLHVFYDSRFNSEWHELLFPSQNRSSDETRQCPFCHISKLAGASLMTTSAGINPAGWSDYIRSNDQTGTDNEYSWVMHYFHAQLQYNTDKTDIARHQGDADQASHPDGSIKRWDFATQGPNNSTTTGSLFPIFDDNGQQLPMEQNCLRCHAGHREPLYRDRMMTAGRTCYDCHGDMGAMGQAFKKPVGLSKGATARTSWADQPDCAACHTGNGNQGKDAKNGFFSAGVMERAFDDQVINPATNQAEANHAATPRQPDLGNQDASRFAVVQTELNQVVETKGGVVYRLGKDQHGYTGCPACHGGAHGVGPNRDPKANDNIAAIELQGYPGPIFECNVCHTKDAFNSEESIGSGTHYPDKNGNPVILAGPHNLHPVNDPNWYYQRTQGNVVNTDGTQYGGWHNVWSGKPGLNNEDQCAACHGDDHQGTRLSQTPVDRVFDFSKLDFKKLKKVGFKSRVIKVKAGTSIGCNTCHSLATSQLKTPTGSVTETHSPVILAPDTEEFALENGDTPFSYQVRVQNPGGATLTYILETFLPDFQAFPPIQLSALTIDQQGLITWPKPDVQGPMPFRVKITDANGGQATRWFWTNLAGCASGKSPGAISTCTDITFSDGGFGIMGLNVGESFDFAIPATTPDQRPLSYSLLKFRESVFAEPQGLPEGMTIDASTGAINWPSAIETNNNANSGVGPYYLFEVLTKDAVGEQNLYYLFLFVCKSPQHFDADNGMCM